MRPVLLLIAAVLVLGANAQTWEVYDMNTAGFPSNTITDIAVDSQDRVWVGTDWGLCKYDGGTWTIYQTGNSGLPDNQINTVAVDSLDRVWIGTVLHGVVIFDGNTWENFTTLNSGLPDDEIKCITIDFRGWAWIGTYLGLVCYTGQEWRLYDNQSTSYGGLLLNGNVIEDVAVRPDGLVAIGTLNYGFHYLTDTAVQIHATYIDLFPDNTQNGVAFDEVNDDRWLACPAGGLLRQGGSFAGGPWFQYVTQNSTIPTNTLLSIAMDASGRPWIGTSLAGLAVRNTNGSFTSYSTFNSDLPDNTVPSVAVGHDGSIWAGTYYGGVGRLMLSTDVIEEKKGEDLHIYPNPASDVLMVQSHGMEDQVQWQVMGNDGRMVNSGISFSPETFHIDLEHLACGVYVLRILHGEKQRTVRFQKV